MGRSDFEVEPQPKHAVVSILRKTMIYDLPGVHIDQHSPKLLRARCTNVVHDLS